MNLPVKPGDTIGGKYVIEALLGAGGMGAVFLANHEQLRRHVAIKFLLSEAMSNPEAFARFEREAHAAAALQSDNVTRVIDMGALPDNTPYIVMEYLEGEDLAARLASLGHLPPEQAVAYVIEACDALSEAHALGIVHRDIKPANLFLARRPNGTYRVKVLDFGISKMGASGAHKQMSLTGTGAVMGSPLYMSPEQLKGAGKVDERTDIWALGVVLYEFLSGTPPFVGQAFPEQCALILTAEVPPLRARNLEISPRLEAVVMRCLDKDPAARFSSVGELTAALLVAVPNASLGPASRMAVSQAPSTIPNAPPTSSKLLTPVINRAVATGYGSVTGIPLSTTGVPPVESRRAVGIGVAIAACAVGAAIGAFVVMRPTAPPKGEDSWTSSSPGVATPAKPAPPPPSPATPPVAPVTAAPPPTAEAPAAPVPPPPPTAQAAPARPSPPSGGRSRPQAPAPPAAAPPAPAPAPSPAAATPAAKDCSTPYYFDSQGNKVFKPDCLK
jgi:eukaryotic-like serine/threonine-protein kinase